MHSGKIFYPCALLLITACGASSATDPTSKSTHASGATHALASTVQLAGDAQLCLDTMYNGHQAGSGVQVWTCDGMDDQAWIYKNNQLQIFDNLCLQAGASPLTIQTCSSGDPRQQFTRQGDAFVNAGQCLAVANAATNTPTQLAACDANAPTQKWTVDADGTTAGGTTPAPVGNARTVQVINNCSQTVYAGAFSQSGASTNPKNGGWEMPANSNTTLTIQAPWSGRIWARTGCTFDASGKGSCETGDCGGQLQCGALTGQPASLAEFTFAGYGGQDYYDVSLVDGFNTPISAGPASGSFQNADPKSQYSCGSPSCSVDLNGPCPQALQHAVNGQNVACYNACPAIGGDQLCCAGTYSDYKLCTPNGYSEFFKSACPSAYSYPADDASSTFTCTAASYVVTFCPKS